MDEYKYGKVIEIRTTDHNSLLLTDKGYVIFDRNRFTESRVFTPQRIINIIDEALIEEKEKKYGR